MKKYELVPNTAVSEPGKFRVRALHDFGDVKAGDVGGYVDGEHNLSHDGNAWIYDHAIVTCAARVSGNARIRDHASVTGRAHVSGNACVGGWTEISGDAKISGEAHLATPRPDRGPRAVRHPQPNTPGL